MDLNKILNTIKSYNCNLVEITGGEPLLQTNTPMLISELIKRKFKVLLETNGSIDIHNIHPDCIKIVDIKCPSSRESHNNLQTNLEHLSDQDELKFVIGTREDYEFAKTFISREKLNITPGKIHFSTVFDNIKPGMLAGWILEDRLDVRLSLQMHKIIWDKNKRGV